MTNAAQWVAEELTGMDLGDARRNKRAKHLIERLVAKPAASIPMACRGWAETMVSRRGMYVHPTYAVTP